MNLQRHTPYHHHHHHPQHCHFHLYHHHHHIRARYEPLSVLCGECFVIASPGEDTAGQLHFEWRPRLPGQESGGGDGLHDGGVEVGAGQAEAGPHCEERGLPSLTVGCFQSQTGSYKHRYEAGEEKEEGGRVLPSTTTFTMMFCWGKVCTVQM